MLFRSRQLAVGSRSDFKLAQSGRNGVASQRWSMRPVWYRGAQISTPWNEDTVDTTGSRYRRTSHDDLTFLETVQQALARHHRYLTSVADHQTGAIVWCAPGRNSATLQAFFDELGDHKASIDAVSIDMSGEYQRAIRAAVPQGS